MRGFAILFAFLIPSASAIHFGIHCDGVELIDEFGIDSFINECVKKGYDEIIFNVMPWKYYFISPTLESLGWEYGGDLLGMLVEKAHENGINLYADIQTLAWKYREDYENPGKLPSDDDIGRIVDELAAYEIDGISEEMFPARWMGIAYQKCAQHGIKYIHKHIPYDVAWFNEDGSNVFSAYSNCSVLMTEDYYMNDDLARWQMAAGFSASLKKQLWIKSCPDEWAMKNVRNMENVMIAREIQYGSQHIFAMIYDRETFEKFEPREIEKFVFTPEKKPIFNIIVYLSSSSEDRDAWQLFDISYAAISNAAMASGYDVYITNEPLKNASAYYIYTRGKKNTTLHLPEAIVSILNGNKTVFLEIANDLPVEEEWRQIRKKFGINERVFESIFGEDRVKGMYNGREYYHLSDSWYLFNSITPSDVRNVVSKGKFNGIDYVFIARNGNHIFINGAGLDEEACYPISGILNNALQKPFHGICSIGRKSVFYAYDNSSIKIKFPYEIERIEYVERDINGNVIKGHIQYTGIFEYEMDRGSLLILNLTNTQPYVRITKPRNHLYINDREIIPISSTIVIGRITIMIEKENIDYEEIYINDEIKYRGNATHWLFDEKAFGIYEIKVKGYGRNECEDAVRAYIINF